MKNTYFTEWKQGQFETMTVLDLLAKLELGMKINNLAWYQNKGSNKDGIIANNEPLMKAWQLRVPQLPHSHLNVLNDTWSRNLPRPKMGNQNYWACYRDAKIL